MAGKSSSKDPRIDKRRVTMKSASFDPATGDLRVVQAEDFVRPYFDGEPLDSTAHLDVYVADARTRWQHVAVSEEPDAGPLGYDGPTVIAPHLVGKSPADFARYGDASTPENALDEFHGTAPATGVGLQVTNGQGG